MYLTDFLRVLVARLINATSGSNRLQTLIIILFLDFLLVVILDFLGF